MSPDDILNYIENNLKEDFTLEDLSQKYHYSIRQLYYDFHNIMGMPIMAYVRKRRLYSAAMEIALGRKMYDAAMDYGFDTQAGFYKAFLQCIGCTPSESRRHHQLRQHKKIQAKLLAVREGKKDMNEINIRKMKLEDAKSLWENIFSANTPEEVRLRVQNSVEKMEAGDYIALVAAAEDQIVGTIIAEKSQYILHSHKCELSDVIVNPAFQKRGLGKRLCHEAFAHAKQMGADYVTTSCRGDGSEHFYKAIGMEQCGRIPDGIREPWGEERVYDEFFFYKKL